MNYTTKYQDDLTINREYKSTLFCMTFKAKKDLLNLYNAVNGTDYDDPEDLNVTTLENAIYLTMKNDVSFLFDSRMNLYEHQSTYNPNMPLRGFIYLARLYEKYIASHKINIYSSTLQKIPAPRYIVFYNGSKLQPDTITLRLSDAFEQEDGCLECEVTMLNINYGRNQKLMEKCRRLEEYAIFIDRVRTLSAKVKDFPSAINQAIDECIYEGILADLLTEQRAEVHEVILTTFDKELYENGLKEDAYKEGYNEGKTDGFNDGFNNGFNDGFNDGFNNGQVSGSQKKLMEQIQKKLEKGKSIEIIADELEETPEVIQALISQVSFKE